MRLGVENVDDCGGCLDWFVRQKIWADVECLLEPWWPTRCYLDEGGTCYGTYIESIRDKLDAYPGLSYEVDQHCSLGTCMISAPIGCECPAGCHSGQYRWRCVQLVPCMLAGRGSAVSHHKVG